MSARVDEPSAWYRVYRDGIHLGDMTMTDSDVAAMRAKGYTIKPLGEAVAEDAER